jgi:hypothetical protein
MVSLLLFSLMLELYLLIFLTKAELQKRSIANWLSKSMTSRRSSLIVEPACLKSFTIIGSNCLSTYANWRSASISKCDASSSHYHSEISDSASFNCASWVLTVANAFLMDLMSFLSFLILLAVLAKDLSSLSFDFLGKCVAGCPFLSHL